MPLEQVKKASKATEDLNRQPIQLKYSRLFLPLITLGNVLIILAGLNFLSLNQIINNHTLLLWLNMIILLVGLFFIFRISFLIRHDLVTPFIHLRNWALQMKKKDYSARLPMPKKGEFAKLAVDINSLSDKLQSLSAEFQQEVDKQIHKVEEKNHSLNILYEVATSINRSEDLDDLLSRFLQMLVSLTNARAGTVRLRTDNDQLKMVASIGLNDQFVREERYVPIKRCLCGTSLTQGSVECNVSIKTCTKLSGTRLFDGNDAEIIAVPLEHQGVHLGIYNLFIDKPNVYMSEDLSELLTSIGKHLGMAIEKSRLDKDTRQHSVMKERTLLAHELHDSLAQTLASLRFQVTILEENVLEKIPVEREEVTRLHESIDEAYREVRGLITHFRAPMNKQGLIPAIEQLVSNFQSNHDISIFFQNEWSMDLKSDQEFQIVRIVQESLANVGKHSKARAVRILARSPKNPNYNNKQCEILIEDDGIGMKNPNLTNSLGEHIGISVMEERARRIGGDISIETEAGEGTQILLTFPTQAMVEKSVKFFPNLVS
ncbi:histidine kinase [sulfur-oxidizing endosymbiont of Gigantopelta aegis]|uniref:histidine kinase n=1 Tax=sulfur-oxidizing endosymbiont of Gigantopelta aegis TaxID=2794934 RepID=UPI0018DB23FB|nr:histidine kinase [sulfur-oxidizing endosymbiont of Gigantopelta aegis]